MKTILILNKQTLEIESMYKAEEPNQSSFGGPWGRPEQTIHVDAPDGMDVDCLEIELVDDQIVIDEDLVKKAAKVAAATTAEHSAAYDAAVQFGAKIVKKFALENMGMGITQAGKTGEVRKAMAEVISALQTGSLYDAISEARAIPEEKKDATFITDARLLAAINQIEAFLGQPISEEL